MSQSIIWLASYPKSGNTWLRLFLFNYLFNLDEPAPINQAHRIGPSDASAVLYKQLASGQMDLTNIRDVLRLRPKVVSSLANNGADVNFMKTHNANVPIEGADLIPVQNTRGAIYVIRDPSDMLVSFTHHYSVPTERAIHAINSESHTIYADKEETVVPQYLGSWSDHVRSWVDATGFKTHVMRYEDMQADPVTAFGAALDYIGAPKDTERLERAVRFSSFKEAKKQEEEYGFVEKPKDATRFFRSGKTGEGRQNLPDDILAQLEADHGDVMKRFGYL